MPVRGAGAVRAAAGAGGLWGETARGRKAALPDPAPAVVHPTPARPRWDIPLLPRTSRCPQGSALPITRGNAGSNPASLHRQSVHRNLRHRVSAFRVLSAHEMKYSSGRKLLGSVKLASPVPGSISGRSWVRRGCQHRFQLPPKNPRCLRGAWSRRHCPAFLQRAMGPGPSCTPRLAFPPCSEV